MTISKINYTINYKERRPNKNNVTQNVKLVLNIYPVSNFLYKTNKKGKQTEMKRLNRRLSKSKGIYFTIDEDLGDFEIFDQKDAAIKEIHENCRYGDIPYRSGFWGWSKYTLEDLPNDNDYISDEDARYFVIESDYENLS